MSPPSQPPKSPAEAENLDRPSPNKHISFSEFKKWNACPFARELAYGQRIKLFNGNTYTAFGSALHETIESIYDPLVDEDSPVGELFLKNLKNQFGLLSEDQLDLKLASEMPAQGLRIMDKIEEGALGDYFGNDFEVISLEEKLYVPIKEIEGQIYNFKGFIDIVIRTPDDIYHIIDWKSCTWGWDSRRKTEPMTVYQLTFYKKFFSEKHNIDPSKIKTYFALLKRTPSKNNIEIFEVTNGKKRVQNAVQSLSRAIANITGGLCIKNRLACRRCEYYKTEHCP